MADVLQQFAALQITPLRAARAANELANELRRDCVTLSQEQLEAGLTRLNALTIKAQEVGWESELVCAVRDFLAARENGQTIRHGVVAREYAQALVRLYELLGQSPPSDWAQIATSKGEQAFT